MTHEPSRTGFYQNSRIF